MLTAREVMKELSHVHPDTPVVIRMERLYYEEDEDNPSGPPVLNAGKTEVEYVAASMVRPLLDGRVAVE